MSLALNSVFINQEIIPWGLFSANPVGASVVNPGTYLEGRVIDQPYLKHLSAVAIHNGKGSGVRLRVKMMNLHAINGAQTGLAQMKLSKITAYTGGVEMTPDKMDSSNSDLPSQFKCVQFPYTVTETANTVVRSAMTLTEASFTTALSALISQNNGDARSGNDSSEFIRLTGDADTQPHVLREGEGLSFIATTNSSTHCFAVSILMKDHSSGDCYRLNTTIYPIYFSAGPIFAVINGSGSGIVMDIMRIQIREIGTGEYGIADYSRIDGIDDNEIEYPNFVLANSGVSIPSQIKIRKNAVCAMAGSKIGALMTQTYLRRLSLTESPWGPGVSSGPDLRKGVYTRDLLSNPDSCVVLNEGEGIGIFIRNASATFYYDFTAIIDIEEIPVGTSGPTCWAY